MSCPFPRSCLLFRLKSLNLAEVADFLAYIRLNAHCVSSKMVSAPTSFVVLWCRVYKILNGDTNLGRESHLIGREPED